MKPRRILFGNLAIHGRSGTEMFLFDLVRGVLRAGNTVGIFSPRLGPMAAEFAAAGVPVWSNVEEIPWAPDVLHCQHALETLQLVARFPAVPALYVCHDAQAWHDAAPPLPSIARFVAVDDYCRARVAQDTGLSLEEVAVIPNSVDLDRFLPRGPLPTRPQRALLFASFAPDTQYLAAVRSACAIAGLPLDEVGPAVGRIVNSPEQVLPPYDLVFAKARCALEAMAVGAAVILVGPEGIGRLVMPEDFEAFRRRNFGRSLLTPCFSAEELAGEIARYDAGAARQVHERVRRECGAAAMVGAFLRLYDEVAEVQPSRGDARLIRYLGRLAAGVGPEALRIAPPVVAQLIAATSEPLPIEAPPEPVIEAPLEPVIAPVEVACQSLRTSFGQWFRKKCG